MAVDPFLVLYGFDGMQSVLKHAKNKVETDEFYLQVKNEILDFFDTNQLFIPGIDQTNLKFIQVIQIICNSIYYNNFIRYEYILT